MGEPIKYTYNTSGKSYLDVLHEPLWNKCAELFAYYTPRITPNMVTLMGVLPIISLCIAYIYSYITNYSMFYFVLGIMLIFYLNMDSIDGKLARLTNRSSPYGQMLDHGGDAFGLGCIVIMMLTDVSYRDIYGMYRMFVFFSLMLIYYSQALCNIHEHYRGSMIVSIGYISTTELLYSVSMVSFIFSTLYYFECSGIVLYLRFTGIVISIICSTLFSYGVVNTLVYPCNIRFADIIMKVHEFILTSISIFLINYLLSYSIFGYVCTVFFMSSMIIDIIYANGTKNKELVFDYAGIVIIFMIPASLCFFGYNGMSLMYVFFGMYVCQFYYNKTQMKEYILKNYH